MKRASKAEQAISGEVRRVQQTLDDLHAKRRELTAQIDVVTAVRDRMEDEVSNLVRKRKVAAEAAGPNQSAIMRRFVPTRGDLET